MSEINNDENELVRAWINVNAAIHTLQHPQVFGEINYVFHALAHLEAVKESIAALIAEA
jgi:hypothetical protein